MFSSSRNGARVRLLAVHTTEGMMSVGALRDFFNRPDAAGSSHAASDETGALWGPTQGYVPYEQAAWTLRNGNPISENIEQCAWSRYTRADWLARPNLLDATARWLAERSKARWIPLVKLTAADILAGKSGVIGHVDWTNTGDGSHTDPGPNYPWDVVLDKARAYAGGANPGGFLMALSDAAQDELLKRVRDISVLLDAAVNPDDKGFNSRGELTKRMRDIHGLVATLAARDPKVEISAATIAAAIPLDLARQVADELATRLSQKS